MATVRIAWRRSLYVGIDFHFARTGSLRPRGANEQRIGNARNVFLGVEPWPAVICLRSARDGIPSAGGLPRGDRAGAGRRSRGAAISGAPRVAQTADPGADGGA